MARTRAAKSAPAQKGQETESKKPTLKQLDASVETPPNIFVLPKDASPEACIATITNPATFTPTRYLICPQQGFYEFIRVAAPKRQHRSWLLAPDRSAESTPEEDDTENAPKKDEGYVLQAPDMFVATPIDPLFLLLPSLVGDSSGQEFLAASDFIIGLTKTSPHFSHILKNDASQKLHSKLESRIEAVSDCVDMGDEKMYALALPKLVKEIVSKAKRMTAKGLPASMEDRFVKQALDVPVLSVKREESSVSVHTENTAAGAESATESQESVNSAATTTSVSTAATSASVLSTEDSPSTSSETASLLRLRVALNLILSTYIVPKLRQKLEPLLSSPQTSGLDFSALEKHLEHIAALKKEAQALRSLSDNISRKRANEDDEEAAAEKGEKKRKKVEEETRKTNTSQGVKKLMKADKSGMKKLSSFFTKAPAAKK